MQQPTVCVDHPVLVGTSVKGMPLDAVPVSVKDVMNLLASVKRENAFVTSLVALQNHHEETELTHIVYHLATYIVNC